MKLYLVLALLLTSISAHAGNEFGNGGDVIVCPDGKVTFFDWFETQTRYKMSIVPTQSPTLMGKVQELLDRLLPLNPIRRSLYMKDAAVFFENAEFIPAGNRLTDIPDADSGFIPEGCKLQQLIVQGKPSLPGDKWYTIDQDFWNRLPLEQQAAVITHEILLKDATVNGKQTNSRHARYFNALLLSNSIATLSQTTWLELFKQIGFGEFDFQDLYLNISGSSRVSTNEFEAPIYGVIPDRLYQIGPIKFGLQEHYTENKNDRYYRPYYGYYYFKKDSFLRIENSTSFSDRNYLNHPVFINVDFPEIEKFSGAMKLISKIDHSFETEITKMTSDGGLAPVFLTEHFPYLQLKEERFEECKTSHYTADWEIKNSKISNLLIKMADNCRSVFVTPQGLKFTQILTNGNFHPEKVKLTYSGKGVKIQNFDFEIMAKTEEVGRETWMQWPLHSTGFVKTAKHIGWDGPSLKFFDGKTKPVANGSTCQFNDKELAISCEKP